VCGILSKKKGKTKAATGGIVCGIIASVFFALILILMVIMASTDDDKNPMELSQYYGKSIATLEQEMNLSLEEDGTSYYSGTFSINTDEDGNIMRFSMIFTPLVDEDYTFEGISMQDSIEDAAEKLLKKGYTLAQDDDDAQVYESQDDMVVLLTRTSEDEYYLQYMSMITYAEQPEDDYMGNEDMGYYVTDTAWGNTISTHVYYAYTVNSFGSNIVRVECEITNISDDSITFDAEDYYVLDNDGVSVDVNITDYDYKEISAGTSFRATLSFTCPETSNTDLSMMTMTADNEMFNLGDKPQSESEKKEFYGTYNRAKSKLIILETGDNSYQLYEIVYLGDEPTINTYDISLDENNMFYKGYAQYLWVPEEYAIYAYDSTWEEIDENQTPWTKDY
jgi:hypothetical protein